MTLRLVPRTRCRGDCADHDGDSITSAYINFEALSLIAMAHGMNGSDAFFKDFGSVTAFDNARMPYKLIGQTRLGARSHRSYSQLPEQ